MAVHSSCGPNCIPPFPCEVCAQVVVLAYPSIHASWAHASWSMGRVARVHVSLCRSAVIFCCFTAEVLRLLHTRTQSCTYYQVPGNGKWSNDKSMVGWLDGCSMTSHRRGRRTRRATQHIYLPTCLPNKYRVVCVRHLAPASTNRTAQMLFIMCLPCLGPMNPTVMRIGRLAVRPAPPARRPSRDQLVVLHSCTKFTSDLVLRPGCLQETSDGDRTSGSPAAFLSQWSVHPPVLSTT